MNKKEKNKIKAKVKRTENELKCIKRKKEKKIGKTKQNCAHTKHRCGCTYSVLTAFLMESGTLLSLFAIH